MNYEKVIGVNNVLKLNDSEQQDDIKHLQEQCEIYIDDEVQDFTAFSTP